MQVNCFLGILFLNQDKLLWLHAALPVTQYPNTNRTEDRCPIHPCLPTGRDVLDISGYCEELYRITILLAPLYTYL
jgi:hypothetical protein